MNYEEVTYTVDGVDYKSIIIDLGDGAFKSFPADPNNPEYETFLKTIEAEATPAPKATEGE